MYMCLVPSLSAPVFYNVIWSRETDENEATEGVDCMTCEVLAE